MRRVLFAILPVLAAAGAVVAVVGNDGAARADPVSPAPPTPFDSQIAESARRMLDEGRQTFRYDTFGSEAFWGGQLRLHEAIAGAANGGTGPGVSPKAALGLGLKVDMDAVPPNVAAGIKSGQVNLDDPASTVALLQANAVVGVRGFFAGGKLASIGVNCALCHSTVDNAFAPGIGHRLDGWPNRDLDVGQVAAAAPNLRPFAELLGVDVETVKKVLKSWGPGRYDAELDVDGKAAGPDGKSGATLIPAAFGKAGVNEHTWGTGWGDVTYWNAYVANTQMHGQGTFLDARLDDAAKYPVAAKAGFGHKRDAKDLITSKLPALHFYQLAIPAPTPPPGSFEPQAASRGAALFTGAARCASCHVPPIFTEPGWNTHSAQEIGIDDFHASRSPGGRYRTTPLRGLFAMSQGGFYHDGRFATLKDVVDHYNQFLKLGLDDAQKSDLIEYLKSL